MLQVQKNFGRSRTRLHHHIPHTTNASLIIQRSKHLGKQSKDWLLVAPNHNAYQ